MTRRVAFADLTGPRVDATEFANAMKRWVAAGNGQPAEAEPVNASSVTVLFVSTRGR